MYPQLKLAMTVLFLKLWQPNSIIPECKSVFKVLEFDFSGVMIY